MNSFGDFIDKIAAWCKKHPFLALMLFWSFFNNQNHFFGDGSNDLE